MTPEDLKAHQEAVQAQRKEFDAWWQKELARRFAGDSKATRTRNQISAWRAWLTAKGLANG